MGIQKTLWTENVKADFTRIRTNRTRLIGRRKRKLKFIECRMKKEGLENLTLAV